MPVAAPDVPPVVPAAPAADIAVDPVDRLAADASQLATTLTEPVRAVVEPLAATVAGPVATAVASASIAPESAAAVVQSAGTSAIGLGDGALAAVVGTTDLLAAAVEPVPSSVVEPMVERTTGFVGSVVAPVAALDPVVAAVVPVAGGVVGPPASTVVEPTLAAAAPVLAAARSVVETGGPAAQLLADASGPVVAALPAAAGFIPDVGVDVDVEPALGSLLVVSRPVAAPAVAPLPMPALVPVGTARRAATDALTADPAPWAAILRQTDAASSPAPLTPTAVTPIADAAVGAEPAARGVTSVDSVGVAILPPPTDALASGGEIRPTTSPDHSRRRPTLAGLTTRTGLGRPIANSSYDLGPVPPVGATSSGRPADGQAPANGHQPALRGMLSAPGSGGSVGGGARPFVVIPEIATLVGLALLGLVAVQRTAPPPALHHRPLARPG